MTRGPYRPTGADDAPAQERQVPREERSLAAVHRTDLLLDVLADRRHDAAGPGATDPLPAALAGWVRAIDEEVAVALRGRAARDAGPGRPPVAAPVPTAAGHPAGAAVDLVAPSSTGPRPARSGATARLQWRVLSASAAAVIAVLAVGVGLQDTAQVGPGGSTVAESVQSVEATLVASMLAAEAGDVEGARVLLDQARSMVEALPEDQRVLWETAIGHTERGLRSAEEAVRRGQPVPALVGVVPGVGTSLVPGGSGQDIGRARLGEQGALPPLGGAAGSDAQGGSGEGGNGNGQISNGQGSNGQVGNGQGGNGSGGNGQGNGQGSNGQGSNGSGSNGSGGNGQGSGAGDDEGPDIGQGQGQAVDRERPERGTGATPTPARPSATPSTTTPTTPRTTAPGRPSTSPTPPASTPAGTPTTAPSTAVPDSPRNTPTRRPVTPGAEAPSTGATPGGGQGSTQGPRGGRDTGRSDGTGRTAGAGRGADASAGAGGADETTDRSTAAAGSTGRPAAPGRSRSQP